MLNQVPQQQASCERSTTAKREKTSKQNVRFNSQPPGFSENRLQSITVFRAKKRVQSRKSQGSDAQGSHKPFPSATFTFYIFPAKVLKIAYMSSICFLNAEFLKCKLHFHPTKFML